MLRLKPLKYIETFLVVVELVEPGAIEVEVGSDGIGTDDAAKIDVAGSGEARFLGSTESDKFDSIVAVESYEADSNDVKAETSMVESKIAEACSDVANSGDAEIIEDRSGRPQTMCPNLKARKVKTKQTKPNVAARPALKTPKTESDKARSEEVEAT